MYYPPPEPQPDSDFLSFFSLNSRFLADLQSHLGQLVKLMKFEAEYDYIYTESWLNTKYRIFTPETPPGSD